MPHTKKRFPFATVSVARNGRSMEVVKFHDSYETALAFANEKNGDSHYGDEEYAVVVRAHARPRTGARVPAPVATITVGTPSVSGATAALSATAKATFPTITAALR